MTNSDSESDKDCDSQTKKSYRRRHKRYQNLTEEKKEKGKQQYGC